jgi:hypothetical protein
VNDTVQLHLAAAMVGCGDIVRAEIVAAASVPSPRVVELRCRLTSASPREVTVASHPLGEADPRPWVVRLAVPHDGPITANGQSLAVSWVVVAVNADGVVIAEVWRCGSSVTLRRRAEAEKAVEVGCPAPVGCGGEPRSPRPRRPPPTQRSRWPP